MFAGKGSEDAFVRHTDLLIQRQEKQLLQELIEKNGIEVYKDRRRVLWTQRTDDHVIATGAA